MTLMDAYSSDFFAAHRDGARRSAGVIVWVKIVLPRRSSGM